MYKLLLLTDFSAASQHAIVYTQALFSDTAADFCLLHAFPFVPEEGYSGTLLLGEQLESAEKAMQALKRSITRQPVPAYHTYRTLVALGSPERALEVQLAQEHFDLIVVGATGSGRNEFFGSVATGLIRTAQTNVLVVPTVAPIRPLSQLVLATDYRSVNDAESFGLLNDLASRKAAQLTVLTIEKSRQEQAEAASRSYVLTALANLKTDTYTINDDDVRHGIDAYLDTHTVDLLVVLPHHKGFLDILTGNSIARSMAFHPRVPLLSLYDSTSAAPQTRQADSKADGVPFTTSL